MIRLLTSFDYTTRKSSHCLEKQVYSLNQFSLMGREAGDPQNGNTPWSRFKYNRGKFRAIKNPPKWEWRLSREKNLANLLLCERAGEKTGTMKRPEKF